MQICNEVKINVLFFPSGKEIYRAATGVCLPLRKNSAVYERFFVITAHVNFG